MGETGDEANISSIQTSINKSWGELVEGGHLTYTDLNLYSEKEDGYHVCVDENSPYPRVVVMVEKASLFEPLKDIAYSYGISFVATGGQNSRAAALSYATELERKGVDLSEDFTVFTFFDLDPEGWRMPEVFAEHLALKIDGEIDIIRVGITKDQIGESVLKHQAIPYSLEGNSEKIRRSKRTKYENFVKESGGVFISDDNGNLISARVELNIYQASQIKDKILTALAEHIDGFEYQKSSLKGKVHNRWDSAYNEVIKELTDPVSKAYEDYYSAIDRAIAQLRVERSWRGQSQRAEIRALYDEISELEEEIEEECSDIDEKLSQLHNLTDKVREQEDEAEEHIQEMVDQQVYIPTADDLVKNIESNGGWRKWAEENNAGILGKNTVKEAGESGFKLVTWIPDNGEVVQDWIYEEISKAVEFAITPVIVPDESPDDMIQRVLWDE